MTTIVFVADILVEHVSRERRHFELSEEVASELLAKLGGEKNKLGVNVDELKNLLKNRGEISSAVVLGAQRDEVKKLLTALTVSAWEHEVPFTVDETEYCGRNEERFDGFQGVYMKEGDEWDLGVKSFAELEHGNT